MHTPFLKDCLVWVDGFAGFTTSELLLLTELLKVSASSKIALCLDPGQIEEDWAGIFEPTKKTYTDLLRYFIREAAVQFRKGVRYRNVSLFAGIQWRYLGSVAS